MARAAIAKATKSPPPPTPTADALVRHTLHRIGREGRGRGQAAPTLGRPPRPPPPSPPPTARSQDSATPPSSASAPMRCCASRSSPRSAPPTSPPRPTLDPATRSCISHHGRRRRRDLLPARHQVRHGAINASRTRMALESWCAPVTPWAIDGRLLPPVRPTRGRGSRRRSPLSPSGGLAATPSDQPTRRSPAARSALADRRPIDLCQARRVRCGPVAACHGAERPLPFPIRGRGGAAGNAVPRADPSLFS